MITHNLNNSFNAIATSFSGEKNSYVLSTAKDGLFSGLSTILLSSTKPPFAGLKYLMKITYFYHVNTQQRRNLHQLIVNELDKVVDEEDFSDISMNINPVQLKFQAIGYSLKEQKIASDFIYF